MMYENMHRIVPIREAHSSLGIQSFYWFFYYVGLVDQLVVQVVILSLETDFMNRKSSTSKYMVGLSGMVSLSFKTSKCGLTHPKPSC